MNKLEKLKQEYSTIKTRAMGGIRITRKEAIRALKLKRRINKIEQELKDDTISKS